MIHFIFPCCCYLKFLALEATIDTLLYLAYFSIAICIAICIYYIYIYIYDDMMIITAVVPIFRYIKGTFLQEIL